MAKTMTSGIQCRTQHSEYQLHIQAIGPFQSNRDYGWAGELRAPPSVVEWVGEQEATHKSAASPSVYYIPMDLLLFSDDTCAFLIHGDEKNHPKGLVMGVKPDNPAVKDLIDYALQIGCGLVMGHKPKDKPVYEYEMPEHPQNIPGESEPSMMEHLSPPEEGDDEVKVKIDDGVKEPKEGWKKVKQGEHWEYIDGEWVPVDAPDDDDDEPTGLGDLFQ